MTDGWLSTISIYHACLIAILTYILYITWQRSKYPPGPWPLPIIGNLHLLSRRLHHDLTNLAQHYGPLYTVWMAQRPTVVVSDLQFGIEVSSSKGVEFGGRAMDSKPMSIVCPDHEDLASRSLDEKVTVMRKIALSVIKSKGAGGLSVTKIIEEEAKYVLQEIEKYQGLPFNPHDLTKLAVANTIMDLLFNYRFQGLDDPEYLKYVEAGNKDRDRVKACVLADFFPLLWYIVPSIRKAANDFVNIGRRSFIVNKFTKCEKSYQEGKTRDLADVIIKTQRELAMNDTSSVQLSKANCELLLANIHSGGTETTIDMIMWSFAAILHQPFLQEKIYEELVNVIADSDDIGHHQTHFDQTKSSHYGIRDFIDISFKPKLPYLNAFIHEVMRMCPTVPLALPHKAMVDASVGKFSIPKGTAVMLNIFAMHRDGKIWQEPLTFRPERFLTKEGNFDSNKAKNLITFGKGPRNCIGENLARVELFIFLANIFYKFTLSTPDPEKVPVLGEGDFGLAINAKPFDVIFTSRQQNVN